MVSLSLGYYALSNFVQRDFLCLLAGRANVSPALQERISAGPAEPLGSSSKNCFAGVKVGNRATGRHLRSHDIHAPRYFGGLFLECLDDVAFSTYNNSGVTRVVW